MLFLVTLAYRLFGNEREFLAIKTIFSFISEQSIIGGIRVSCNITRVPPLLIFLWKIILGEFLGLSPKTTKLMGNLFYLCTTNLIYCRGKLISFKSKPWMRKVRTSSHHLLAEIRAIHGTWYISIFFLGIKLFCLSR